MSRHRRAVPGASSCTMEAAASVAITMSCCHQENKTCSEEAGETLGALGLLELMHESMGPRDIADDIISERQGPCLWVLWTHMGRLSIYILSTGPTTQGSCGVKE